MYIFCGLNSIWVYIHHIFGSNLGGFICTSPSLFPFLRGRGEGPKKKYYTQIFPLAYISTAQVVDTSKIGDTGIVKLLLLYWRHILEGDACWNRGAH